MKPVRVLAASAVGAALLLGVAVPAQAGGPVTLFDPVPERFQPDHSYTLGYWFLQHGPRGANLGAATVRLAGANDQELVFDAVELPESGHYAVALAVPAGSWAVYTNVAGFPSEYYAGLLTVPGTLEMADTGEITVCPTTCQPDKGYRAGPAPTTTATAVVTATVAAVVTAAAGPARESPGALLAFGAAAGLVGIGLGLRHLLRRRLPG